MNEIEILKQPKKLPARYIAAIAIIIVSQIAVLLLSQPAAYWLDSTYASINLPLSFLLKMGPLFFLVISVVYLAIAIFLMTSLPAKISFPIASGLFVIHSLLLFYVFVIEQSCFEPADVKLGSFYYYVVNGVVYILFVSAIITIKKTGLQNILKRMFDVFAVLWIALLGYGFTQIIPDSESVWQPVISEHNPGYLTHAVIAYDKERDRAVLFGGMNWEGKYSSDTWEWDGYDWQKMETDVHPPARINHTMAFDENRGTVVMYGGEDDLDAYSDFWEWNGSEWQEICPSCTPAKRFAHQMVYDESRNMVVVYGGKNEEEDFAEGWGWDGDSWHFLSITSNTPGIMYSRLVYDVKNHRTMLVNMNVESNTTWFWEGTTWTESDLEIQPSGRLTPALVYDPENEVVVLFGGLEFDALDPKNDSRIWLNDTWIFDGDTWEQIYPSTSPPARTGSAYFYDEIRHSVIIFGGERQGSDYNDMWEFVL